MVPDAHRCLAYLFSLESVRARSQLVFEAVLRRKSPHFDLNLDRLDDVAQLVISLIRRDYPSTGAIPARGRLRQFEVDGIERLRKVLDSTTDPIERCRRVLDLVVVSVLLDAGAGNDWQFYEETTDRTYKRSEGLALASLYMFTQGHFSSESDNPLQVDAQGLLGLQESTLLTAFQVTPGNPLVGVQGRLGLLHRLGATINNRHEYFGGPKLIPRPGHMFDYFIRITYGRPTIHVHRLWDVIIGGLAFVWPPHTQVGDLSLGDAWHCQLITTCSSEDGLPDPTRDIVPFHKLPQWMTYSLIEVLETVGGLAVIGTELMTGLPEYRNGGLFLDMKVLELKPHLLAEASSKAATVLGTSHSEDNEAVLWVNVDDPIVIEWRALTVVLVDKVASRVREMLGLSEKDLPLAQIAEAGTWKAGREMAALLRPITRGPPIAIYSDGTVF